MDTEQLLKRVQVGNLVRQGCDRSILLHFVQGYGIAEALPKEKRAALARTGISEKQLRSIAQQMHEVANFLDDLRRNPHFVIANDIPHRELAIESRDLRRRAEWLESLQPFRRDDRDERLLAMALHIKERTGKSQLAEMCKLLNATASAACRSDTLTVDTLRKRLQRANRERAEQLLEVWPATPEKKR